ncbi:hypothetical protein [Streptomyces sp. NPDC048309]|uniref:hypothetical protein n=1 Tax=Streptomyces sp. NPDC048309 TaxID=3154618 RepID=UPI0033F18D76
MTRAQLTDTEWEFIGPYLPIGEYGPYPERLRQQFEGLSGGTGGCVCTALPLRAWTRYDNSPRVLHPAVTRRRRAVVADTAARPVLCSVASSL